MSPTTVTETTVWPPLPYAEWHDTQATLHLWTQIVGKIRLAQTPWTNHSWHVPLYVTSRGLTTSPIPYGERTFEIDFDFLQQVLRIQTSDGATETLALAPRTVADFYHELFQRLRALGLDVSIRTAPCEIPEAIPFETDREHGTYVAEQATRFWRVLVQADRLLKQFRARFAGKSSPVHFFWGSFDLAVTRFSGRRAPPHPGGVPNLPDWVVREAYSHEVSSCGFWPGGEIFPHPVFYAYAYPEPVGFKTAAVRPEGARYNDGLGEFVLPYEDVRRSSPPDGAVLEFLQSTYEAAAVLGGWDRSALELRAVGVGGPVALSRAHRPAGRSRLLSGS
ncbi:MAG TPA: DUF5996 family protein [Gemmatimonadales bacterium]|nr:DUF5996 family protein [Gemmatimonadales bacterium]